MRIWAWIRSRRSPFPQRPARVSMTCWQESCGSCLVPKGDPQAPLKVLVFDAHFDRYRGVILQCRIMEGTLKPRDTIHFMHAGWDYTVEELGYNQLRLYPKEQLSAGEVGYIVAGIKSVREIEIGDTITHLDRQAAEPIPGYKKARQVVFSSIYPMNADEYKDLSKAMDKLAINDAALTYEKDSSAALGFGFRCGFLGLLHLDVIQERLQREFDIGLVISAPSVKYKVTLRDGKTIDVDNPSYWPDPMKIDSVTEPYIKASILTPEEYVGPFMELCRVSLGESGDELSLRGPGRSDQRDAAGRGALRFLRQAQDGHPRLRFVRLRHHRLSRDRCGQGRNPD